VDGTDFADQRQDLLQSIEREQEEVRVAVHELTAAARSTLDLREHVKRYPLTWAMGALLVGLWLGRRGGGGDPADTRRPG
jgi:hypothetical protein